MGEGALPRSARSVCPVCLRALPAVLRRKEDGVFLERACPEHGVFSACVWKGEPDFAVWSRGKEPAPPRWRERPAKLGCPHDCGRCPEHRQSACTVLFEITEQCNLHCPVCFARSGGHAPPPPLEELQEQLRWIREHAGEVVLQISGGEPTLHPELPELVRCARSLFPAVQLNTNGLLLAERPELARLLAGAGLSWVFLQFDGTRDDIFTALRGRPLLRQKLAAVEHCREAGLSVVLVPTVAAGVNDGDLGNLLRLALSLAPTVRGLHIQPMTASGRNTVAPRHPGPSLPETLCAICDQSGGLMRAEHAVPPGCEHERCSFHCRYRITPSGGLVPLRPSGEDGQCCAAPGNESGPGRAIDVILRSWGGEQSGAACCAEPGDAFDAFITEARTRTFSVTCMAFQDALTLDLDRLQSCCVHVFSPPDSLIPFCAYNLTALDGTPLHRRSEPAHG